MARRGAPNEDLSNIEFETSEEVEVVPTFNSMVRNISISCLVSILKIDCHEKNMINTQLHF